MYFGELGDETLQQRFEHVESDEEEDHTDDEDPWCRRKAHGKEPQQDNGNRDHEDLSPFTVLFSKDGGRPHGEQSEDHGRQIDFPELRLGPAEPSVIHTLCHDQGNNEKGHGHDGGVEEEGDVHTCQGLVLEDIEHLGFLFSIRVNDLRRFGYGSKEDTDGHDRENGGQPEELVDPPVATDNGRDDHRCGKREGNGPAHDRHGMGTLLLFDQICDHGGDDRAYCACTLQETSQKQHVDVVAHRSHDRTGNEDKQSEQKGLFAPDFVAHKSERHLECRLGQGITSYDKACEEGGSTLHFKGIDGEYGQDNEKPEKP